MTSAFDGTDNVIYTYNENGFPTTEEKSGLITEYEYTPGNLMKSTTHNRRRVNDPTDEDGYNDIREFSSFVYSYYPDGNVYTVTDTRNSKVYDTYYLYDSANRVTRAAIRNGDNFVRMWQYAYNNRGDRTSQEVTDSENVVTTTTYTYTNHRLTSENTAGNVTTYTYDTNGNTLTKASTDATYQYTYTPRNEVASVTTPSGTYTYTYNASSLRTSKTSNGVTTSFIWAGDNIIREETPDKSTDYFYGINRVSRTVKGDAYTYNAVTDSYYDETLEDYVETVVPVNGYHEFYAYDGRGNVVHTLALDSIDLYLSPFYGLAAPFPEMDLNCDGEFDLMDLNTASIKYPIVQDYYYSPFGEIWQGERTTDTNPFRYAGEYLDNETGDIYLRARYYDPSIGRFISVDPIKDGTNWYVYCGNNPVAFVDPSGLYQISTDNNGRVYIVIEEGDTLDSIAADLTGDSSRSKDIICNSLTPSPGDVVDATNLFNENSESSFANSSSSISGIYYQTSLFKIPGSKLQELDEDDYITSYTTIYATNKEAASKLQSWESEYMEDIISTVISSSIKFDTKQVKAVEKVLNMTPAQKELFQREIEMIKHSVGKPNNANFSYKDLLEIGKEIIESFSK